MTKDNWEERTRRLAVPTNFSAVITPEPLIEIHLTLDEWVRLNNKMRIVERSACKLAAGMLKGTLKYETDDLADIDWLRHLSEEIHDSVNYLGLMGR